MRFNKKRKEAEGLKGFCKGVKAVYIGLNFAGNILLGQVHSLLLLRAICG